MLLNVFDYSSPQAALTAAADGDCIYFPGAGTAYRAPSGGWLVQHSLVICGDGPGQGSEVKGTVLLSADASSPVFRIGATVGRAYISDLQLRWDGANTSGTGDGILCDSGSTQLSIERVSCMGFPGNGLNLAGTDDSGSRIDRVAVVDCLFSGCGAAGIRAAHAFNVYVTGTVLTGNTQNGLSASGGSIHMYECISDGNCLTSGWTPSANPYDGNLKFISCTMVRVQACRIRNIEAGNVRKGCVFVGTMGMLGSCVFETDSASLASSCIGIELIGAGSGPIAIFGNRHKNMGTIAKVTAGTSSTPDLRQYTILPQYDETNNGSIVLPNVGDGHWALPHVIRPATVVLGGVSVPSYTQDPTYNVTNGMLAYNKTTQKLRAYVAGSWQSVSTSF